MVHSPVLGSLSTFLLDRPAKETLKRWLIPRSLQSLLAKLYPQRLVLAPVQPNVETDDCHGGSMTMRRVFGVWACFLALIPVLSAGQSQDLVSTGVARDAQSVTLLTQALDAAGGVAAIGKIRDFVGSGEITYYWARKAVHGDVTLRGLGLHQFRLDANLPDGTHSNIINGQKSFRKTPDGNVAALPSKVALKVATVTFPLFQLLTAVQNKSFSVSSDGLVLYEGREAFDILVQKVFPAKRDPLGALGNITKSHIYIDPKSLVILGIRDAAYAMGEGRECPHEMQFSDYRAVDGVLVPLSITESIAGQRTMTIRLKLINFSTGLVDADFE